MQPPQSQYRSWILPQPGVRYVLRLIDVINNGCMHVCDYVDTNNSSRSPWCNTVTCRTCSNVTCQLCYNVNYAMQAGDGDDGAQAAAGQGAGQSAGQTAAGNGGVKGKFQHPSQKPTDRSKRAQTMSAFLQESAKNRQASSDAARDMTAKSTAVMEKVSYLMHCRRVIVCCQCKQSFIGA